MKIILTMLNVMALMLLVSCGGDKNDPKTVSKSDLNPPRNLVTVTGDGWIDLQWQSGNVEEDFKGYHVFGVKKTLAEVSAAAKYPTAVDLSTGSIPRCTDNNDLFTMFAFAKASEADCEGAKTEDTATLASADSSAAAEAETLTNILTCYDPATDTAIGTADISYPVATGSSLGLVKCRIKKIGEDALVDGSTYSFFVTAVSGDKYNTMSWTSNFVQDTPAKSVFDATITLKKDEFVFFPIDATSATTIATAITAPTPAGCDQVADAADFDVCKLGGDNDNAGSGIFLGRDGATTTKYQQRLFISTSTAGKAQIQLNNPMNPGGEFAVRSPGDEAIDNAPGATTDKYMPKGTKFNFKGYEVFDIRVGDSTTYYYGKIVIQSVSYASDSATGDATIKVTIIMQPTAKNPSYLW